MKSAQVKPKTFAEQEKINAVKKHYADIMAGRVPYVGAEKASRKTYCHRGAGMSEMPEMSEVAEVAEKKKRSPNADKVWTVVNNKLRKSKWSTYYDPGEAPIELLQEEGDAWADRE
jgi:hypothetical protein